MTQHPRSRLWFVVLALGLAALALPAHLPGQPLAAVSAGDDEPNKPEPAQPEPAQPPAAVPEKPTREIPPGPFNLAEEAGKAEHPAIKALFTDFGKPGDLLVYRSAQAGEKEMLVEPIAKRHDSSNLANIAYVTLEGKKGVFQPDQVIRIDPYEQRALAAVRKFLDSGLEKPDASGKAALSRFDMLRAAEKLLFEVLSFHTKAKEIRQREGEGWASFGPELEKELLLTQVAQVRALTADQEWGTALALATRLYNDRPGERELLAAIENLHVAQANHLLDSRQDYFQARKVLDSLKAKFKIELPFDAKVQRRLVDHAREKFNAGKKLIDEGKRTEAMKLLEEAAQAWPALPGLEVYIKGSLQEYPVLRVGVRHLPQQLSPTTAASDIDRIASRLIFDSVLQIRYGPMQREGYLSKLGDEPRRVEQGFELEIPQYLRWNDGTEVTSADFLRSGELTAKLDPKYGSPIFNPDAADVMTVAAPDQRRVLFSFKRATIDPLAFLTFDLLPAHRLPANRSPRDQAFGKAPVGTGPFVFSKIEGDEMVFLANPHYRRPWAPAGPAIQEVRFVRYSDFAAAKQAVADGRWQMLLDLTTPEKEELTGLPGVNVLVPTEVKDAQLPHALANPRIYFLAFNFRNPVFQNDALREAIGKAVDRETILREVFRGKGRPYHQVLTGPYPNGSWAVPEGSGPGKVQGFQPSRAATQMNQAKASGANLSSLTISFAEEDLNAAKACEKIKENLEKLGLAVKLKGMPALQLQADLQSERPTFEAVYTHYDFPNELLSLWPLFDTSSVTPLGQNFMGDCRDTALISLFRSMQNKRELGFIVRRTHEAYDLMWRKMHFVPLWQLDPHVAVHRSLVITRLHPTHIFEDVEQWRLRSE